MWLKFSLAVMAIGLFLQISHGVEQDQNDTELPKCYKQSLEAKEALLEQPYEIITHRDQVAHVEEDWCYCFETEYNR